MSTVSRRACAALFVALLLGCKHGLPSAPSELTTGIVIYEHANYLGAAAHVTSDWTFHARGKNVELLFETHLRSGKNLR